MFSSSTMWKSATGNQPALFLVLICCLWTSYLTQCSEPTQSVTRVTMPRITPGHVFLFNQTPITGRGIPNSWVDNTEPEMFGGREAPIKRYPFMVFIIRRGTYPVGLGVLISDFFVLTTAYNALYHRSESLWVRAGSCSPFQFGERRRIARNHVHPMFNYSWEHNLGLMQLREPIYTSPSINYGVIANLYPKVKGVWDYRILGMGHNNLHMLIRLQALRKYNESLLEYDECNELYNYPVEDIVDSILCLPNTTEGPCYWNNGAAVVSATSKKVYALYLGTHQCQRDFSYGAYIKLSPYKKWIKTFLLDSLERVAQNSMDDFDRAMRNMDHNEYNYYED